MGLLVSFAVPGVARSDPPTVPHFIPSQAIEKHCYFFLTSAWLTLLSLINVLEDKDQKPKKKKSQILLPEISPILCDFPSCPPGPQFRLDVLTLLRLFTEQWCHLDVLFCHQIHPCAFQDTHAYTLISCRVPGVSPSSPKHLALSLSDYYSLLARNWPTFH